MGHNVDPRLLATPAVPYVFRTEDLLAGEWPNGLPEEYPKTHGRVAYRPGLIFVDEANLGFWILAACGRGGVKERPFWLMRFGERRRTPRLVTDWEMRELFYPLPFYRQCLKEGRLPPTYEVRLAAQKPAPVIQSYPDISL